MSESTSTLAPAQPPAAGRSALWPGSALHRPSLSTSATDFALPITGSSAPPSPSPYGGDEFRRRRQSLLSMAHPLTAIPRPRSDGEREFGSTLGLASGSASSSSMSDVVTPADLFHFEPARSRASTPSTPPRRRSSMSGAFSDRPSLRRASNPMKLPPRLQYLRSESETHHVEQELKMEAHFQRLLASNESALPLHSPRAGVNRGRFPEEVAPDEQTQQEDDSSDEDVSELPGASTLDDRAMSEDGSTMLRASPAISLMDLDAPITSSHFSVHSNQSNSSSSTPRDRDSWRQTPPPTANGSRINKRKFTDDRYEPYPAAKRRAVSPAFQRDGMLSPLIIPRSPVIRPVPVSVSQHSSPVFRGNGNGNNGMNGMMSLSSSPVLRPSVSHLSSPILRPIVRLRAGAAAALDANADAAGDGVSGLSLS